MEETLNWWFDNLPFATEQIALETTQALLDYVINEYL